MVFPQVSEGAHQTAFSGLIPPTIPKTRTQIRFGTATIRVNCLISTFPAGPSPRCRAPSKLNLADSGKTDTPNLAASTGDQPIAAVTVAAIVPSPFLARLRGLTSNIYIHAKACGDVAVLPTTPCGDLSSYGVSAHLKIGEEPPKQTLPQLGDHLTIPSVLVADLYD
jgi:hypothetical protein